MSEQTPPVEEDVEIQRLDEDYDVTKNGKEVQDQEAEPEEGK